MNWDRKFRTYPLQRTWVTWATGADRLKAGGATNFGREIIATDRAIDGLVYEFSPECARGLRPDLLDRRSADTDAEIGKLVYEFYGITVGCR
jgi:hypothetical protein